MLPPVFPAPLEAEPDDFFAELRFAAPPLRLAEPLLRLATLLPDFEAARFALDLRAPEVDFDELPELFDLEELELFFADEERFAPPLLRDEPLLLLEDAVPLEELPLVSIDHFPDITRCAASATASAINDPSLVALATTDFAAFSVVSAASIPASLIAFRALGLALIAAAAAARPAASISLLIAALASFSPVDLEELDRDDFEVDVRLVDFAIANLRSDSPI